MKTQDGVKKILFSGYRATVVMDDGKELDSEKVKSAITSKSLTFEGFEKVTKPVPVEGYQLKASGTG